MTDRSLLEMTQVQQTVNTAHKYEGGYVWLSNINYTVALDSCWSSGRCVHWGKEGPGSLILHSFRTMTSCPVKVKQNHKNNKLSKMLVAWDHPSVKQWVVCERRKKKVKKKKKKKVCVYIWWRTFSVPFAEPLTSALGQTVKVTRSSGADLTLTSW